MLGWSIEPFGPATMQFNSIPVNDTSELIKTIYWINKNTPNNAMVFGEKHWRGWMDIELQGDRLFKYGSSQYDTLQSTQDCDLNYCYIVTHLSESLHYMNKKVQTEQVYQNKLFTVYKIGSIYDMEGGLSSAHFHPNQKTKNTKYENTSHLGPSRCCTYSCQVSVSPGILVLCSTSKRSRQIWHK
jgi:hypothetical protein